MKTILTGIVAWVVIVCFCLFIYWLGGGNFERGFGLGATTAISVVLGALFSFPFAEDLIYIWNKHVKRNN